MNNPTQHQSPALRIEAGSINCILLYASLYAANRNLLTVADSLSAHYVEYRLLMRLMLLIHLIRRTPRVVYPDGTVVYQKYASTGHFSGITMDTADGSSKGYIVGSYTGPVIENGQFKIIRETGNGVKMEIQYDPIKRRPIGLVTKLASGNIESATSYTYDQKSNITQIADTIVNGRTQDFVYDAQNRLTQASGKYGVENYTYTDNGNLTKRGQFTLAYGDANHKHAVTAVTSPNTGTFNYAYDEAGNMVSRNGDTMSYNAQGKLKQIDTVGGDKLTYLYESTGNRIKKTMKNSGITVYNFDGLYEIERTGDRESHTLYFKGLYGDVFSQMTRSDATLVASSFSGSKSSNSLDVVKSTGIFSFAKGDAFPPNSFVKGFFCEDIAGSCSDYYVNTAKYYYVRSAFRVVGIINTVEYDVFVWGLLVVVLYLVYIQSRRHRRDVARYVSTMIYAKRTLSVTPLLIVSILFTFTQCGLVNGGGKKGEAPWILLASGINNDTASVDEVSTGNTVTPSSPNAPIGSIPPTGSGNNTNGSGGYRPSGSGGYNGGSGGAALVPVTGMYFLHPDHLGSITMITDGRGNVIAGGNNGGKSHISYTPYGSIHRTDSSGPDITRFKYTGQEEDKESGLLYYKARYYDPMIGRFAQADSVIMPESTFGMNRYMYVDGSPVNYRDPIGNSPSFGLPKEITKYFTMPQIKINFNDMNSVLKGDVGTNGVIRRSGFERSARDAKNGVEWGSRNIRNSGLKQAADQFNKMTNQDNEKRSRVNYSHCGVAGPYGYAVRLGAAPLTGLCLLATGIYEFGVRGGWDKIGNAVEGIGGGAGAAGLFAKALEFAGAAEVFAATASAVAVVGTIAKQGDVRYQKIKDHRAYIQLLGCAYASRVAFSTDVDMLLMGVFHCINETNKGED